MDAICKSLEGNKYTQVFANKAFFSRIYPMDSKKKAGDALRLFFQELSVPNIDVNYWVITLFSPL